MKHKAAQSFPLFPTRAVCRWGALTGMLPLVALLHGTPPREIVYRHTAGGDLKLYCFLPEGAGQSVRPAALWIHGGGWVGGTSESFFPMARYTAARGAVSFVVQYRLVQSGHSTVEDAISDCQAAVRYVRGHARELGVEPDHIAVLGESAGGHLAACVGLMPPIAPDPTDAAVSSRPDALVLYNPLTDFSGSSFQKLFNGPGAEVRAAECSPIRQVRPGLPPILCVHGRADTVIPPAQTERFAAALKQAGNRCDLVLLADTPHAFLIPNYKCSQEVVVNALRLQDTFLASLGYFSGEPTLTISVPPPWQPKWPVATTDSKHP